MMKRTDNGQKKSVRLDDVQPSLRFVRGVRFAFGFIVGGVIGASVLFRPQLLGVWTDPAIWTPHNILLVVIIALSSGILTAVFVKRKSY